MSKNKRLRKMTKSSAYVTEPHFELPLMTSELIFKSKSKLFLCLFSPVSFIWTLVALITMATAHRLNPWEEAVDP